MMQCVCDICGKVISNNEIKYQVNIASYGSRLGMSKLYDDVCHKCVDDIRTHIFNMKRGNTDYGVKSTDAGTEVSE